MKVPKEGTRKPGFCFYLVPFQPVGSLRGFSCPFCNLRGIPLAKSSKGASRRNVTGTQQVSLSGIPTYARGDMAPLPSTRGLPGG